MQTANLSTWHASINFCACEFDSHHQRPTVSKDDGWRPLALEHMVCNACAWKPLCLYGSYYSCRRRRLFLTCRWCLLHLSFSCPTLASVVICFSHTSFHMEIFASVMSAVWHYVDVRRAKVPCACITVSLVEAAWTWFTLNLAIFWNVTFVHVVDVTEPSQMPLTDHYKYRS